LALELSGTQKYIQTSTDEPLRQGEIITQLIQFKINLDTVGTENLAVDPVMHPYAIIVSQDCDLDWDYKARETNGQNHKKLPNILFCEVTTFADLTQLLLALDGTEKLKKSRTWAKAKQNKDERYHFLEKVEKAQDVLRIGLPELGVDFKRYFTIPADEVYLRIQIGEAQRRCRLTSPYLEHFTSRFYYFQSRVALPEEHYSEPE
jgi:hypothetical protein